MVTAESGKQHQQKQVRNQNLEDKVQRLKEVAKDCSVAEIESALRESNMDPDVAADKLLTQDPYIEVNRRRNKKKQNGPYYGFTEPRRPREYVAQEEKIYTSDQNIHNVRRGSYPRNAPSGVRDHRVAFRIKNDNRFHYQAEDPKHASAQGSGLFNKRRTTNFLEKSSTGALNNQNQSGGHFIPHIRNSSSHPKFSQSNSYSSSRKEESEKRLAVSISAPLLQKSKQNDPQPQSASAAVSNSVAAYPSASDPVHVPSPVSRSPAAIGSRKRDVGVVGGRWQSSENNVKQSSRPGSSKSSSVFVRTSTIVSSQAGNSSSKHEQLAHATASDVVTIGSAVGRAILGNHHGNRAHHQPAGLKGPVWKPKSSQKSRSSNPGVIGTPVKSASSTSEGSRNFEADSATLQDKLSEVNIDEGQNVIIAEHIRVPENERCRVTFGSFDAELDSSARAGPGFHFQAAGSVEAIEPSFSEDLSGSNQVNSFDEQSRNLAPSSPSGTTSGQQLPDKRESSEAPDIDKCAEVDLTHKNSPPFVASDLQQREDPSMLQNFSVYDPQSGYDLYFRHPINDAVRGQGLPSVPEVLTSHTAASIPASSIAMMQQQPPVPQMYPQVHVSPFPNVMPYRQFISPVYVPQMGGLPGYSSNPAYPHPSNGSSYVLMSGGSSHLAANGLKYGVQQFKPVPAGAPTSFGGFASPTGYAVNAPGVVGGANGLEDSSRLKYKDNHLYMANPQAENSEVWIQNQRELPGMQSTPYFNMQGQTAHPAYLQSHTATGHASFNPAVAAAANAQSSHMQFSGVYHNPQAGAFPNAHHHLGAAMGGNVGIGVAPAAPGAQVGAYQPQQLGHLNWTTNF